MIYLYFRIMTSPFLRIQSGKEFAEVICSRQYLISGSVWVATMEEPRLDALRLHALTTRVRG